MKKILVVMFMVVLMPAIFVLESVDIRMVHSFNNSFIIHRVCIDGYEYVATENTVNTPVEIEQSFENHRGYSLPKTCSRSDIKKDG